MTSEQWLDIPGYEGIYQISSRGRVMSMPREVKQLNRAGREQRRWIEGGIRPHCLNPDGYPRITLYKEGKSETVSIHILVARAFLADQYKPGLEVCHWNGDETDCRVENLRWDTRSANTLDKVRHGTHNNAKKLQCPRRHDLASPNLAPWALGKGHRLCWSCQKAKSTVNLAKKRGVHIDIVELSDSIYRDLMSNAA